jgi:murein L,D-transpeptidase YcbB/YkuD
MRRIAHAMAVVLVALPTLAHADGATDWIKNALRDRETQTETGSAERAAIEGTLSRIRTLSLPETGKVIVVNIASGVVTAYESGTPVIESKAVVGKKNTPTPELDNTVTFVRPNPTWTVPQSIIKQNGWRKKLAEDPQFFENSGFDVIVGGQTMNAFDAADRVSAVDTFVQRPGENNALGAVKIGLSNDQAIYLHDTNDPGKFEAEVRAASHGCVRIEQVREIAAWVLDIPEQQLSQMIASGDLSNHKPAEPVRVILGYWTAWPDETGRVRFYPDIYGKDGGAAQRNVNDQPGTPENRPNNDEQPGPAPRFEPAHDENFGRGNPVPVWTEFRTR